jgi:uncharacterized membrane protein YedE/YeeE
MINPAKVLGFLDVLGAWDPTLLCVMGGALAVTFPAFGWVLKQPRPLLAQRFYLPTRRDIDARLVSGALLFGVGWGLAGLCPGPAIAGLASGRGDIEIFVIAMLAGMLSCKYFIERRSDSAGKPSVTPARGVDVPR